MDSPILSNILKIISLIIGVIGIIISLQIKSRVDNKDALFKTLIRCSDNNSLCFFTDGLFYYGFKLFSNSSKYCCIYGNRGTTILSGK